TNLPSTTSPSRTGVLCTWTLLAAPCRALTPRSRPVPFPIADDLGSRNRVLVCSDSTVQVSRVRSIEETFQLLGDEGSGLEVRAVVAEPRELRVLNPRTQGCEVSSRQADPIRRAPKTEPRRPRSRPALEAAIARLSQGKAPFEEGIDLLIAGLEQRPHARRRR